MSGGAGGPYHHHHQHHHHHHQYQGSLSRSGPNEPTNQRFSNLIHDSEVFLTKLREFKPQSLGCLEARRKSSSTLIFPSPQQACMGPPKCPRYPHNVKPTPGYWIECHGPGILAPTSAGKHSQIAPTGSISSERAGGTTSPLGGSIDYGDSASPRDDKTVLAAAPIAPGSVTGDRGEPVGARPSSQATDGGESGQATAGAAGHAQMRRRQSCDGDQPTSLQQLAEQLDLSIELTGAGEQATVTAIAPGEPRGRQKVAAKSSMSGSMRRKMNKRTMTRDDIDLHKTRRGTPNITITEPSFNQSTTSPFAGPAASRQRSIPAGSSPPETVDTVMTTLIGDDDDTDQLKQRQQPVKFQLERCESIEQHQPAQASYPNERQDSTGSCELSPDLPPQPAQQVSAYHRPSIIREDIDQEAEWLYQHQQHAHPSNQQQGEFYCDLSTTSFTKKRHQFHHHHHHHHQHHQHQGQQAHQHHQHLHLQRQQSGQQQQQQQSESETAAVVAESTEELEPPGASSDHEQFRNSSLELISFEEENYEKHYYGREHWNYFTNDELLGPVMLSLKQEVNNQRDHFHVLLRTVSYTLHGTIPASTICADRYDREAIVRELSEIAKLKPPLMLGQLPSTPDELLKLDHIFIKTELKVGVIYIKQGQEESEESILGNKEESPLFTEFLDLLGDRITLKGFDRYKGGLDTVHNLTGTESVYTMWRNIEIMFHVSTMLPHEENDPQKLQKKRHIGNDIVCVAFIESDDTLFWPGCIKSYFLHTFIAVRTSPKPLKEGEKRKYYVSCVCRNEVQYAFRPYLVEQDNFYKSDYFREWLLVKIVNGERASYSAPKFARMQDRTRSQLLEDIITNLANHLVTGQIPKPYRRGSWRPLGHTRASSPLEDSMKDYFEDYDQLAKDFCNAFCGPNKSVLSDVAFRVKDADGSYKLVYGVRAILAIRSRTFLEMLYGFVPPGTGQTGLQNQTSLRAIEMKALAGESSASDKSSDQHTKSLLAKRGSVGGSDSSRRIGEKERRQSMLPNLSKSISQKPNYLTVPNTSGGGGGGGGTGGVSGSGGSSSGGAGAGGMIKNAFNRLVSGNWSGWSGNIKGYKGEPVHLKVDQNKAKVDLNSLAICKEISKIDADKLTQTEFEIKEFDYETFQQTIEYIHNGQCKLSYETIPGLICAAEHYDLPDLLHACFHHANTHMRLSAAPRMMNALYQNSCFYITAMQLLDAIFEYIDPHGNEFFNRPEYLDLYESVFSSLLCRKTLQVNELRKFQAMDGWSRQQAAGKVQQQQLAKQQQQLQQQQLLRKSSNEQQAGELQQQVSLELQQAAAAASLAVSDQQQQQQQTNDLIEAEYRNLMIRLNKDVNIKLALISNEDLVKYVLPTRVFNNDRIFEVMADESRNDY